MSRHHLKVNRNLWRLLRLRALERDGWRCRQCGKAGVLEVDHVVPLFQGGAPHDLDNLQSLCRSPCHFEKSVKEMGNRPRRNDRTDRWQALVDELSTSI